MTQEGLSRTGGAGPVCSEGDPVLRALPPCRGHPGVGAWGSSSSCTNTKAEGPSVTPISPTRHVWPGPPKPTQHHRVHVQKRQCRPAAPLSALPLELSLGDVQLYTHRGTITVQGHERCEGPAARLLFAAAVPFVWNGLLSHIQKTSPHPVRPGSNVARWSHAPHWARHSARAIVPVRPWDCGLLGAGPLS